MERRKVSFKDINYVGIGYCLLITGGMMSPPVAIVERPDGTMVELPIHAVQFIDIPQWANLPENVQEDSIDRAALVEWFRETYGSDERILRSTVVSAIKNAPSVGTAPGKNGAAKVAGVEIDGGGLAPAT